MVNDLMTGLKDVIEIFGQFSIVLVPTFIAVDIFNALVKQVYPKFNPMTWRSKGGSFIDSMIVFLLVLVVAGYIGHYVSDYQFPNLVIPIIAIVVWFMYFVWYKDIQIFKK